MLIYGSSVSPYVRKTLAFAAEKGVAVDNKVGRPGSSKPEFVEASPFGLIPALRDGDFVLSDSSAIITYIDTLYPEPNLIPLEAKARARTIWFEEFADTILVVAGTKVVFNRLVGPLMGVEGDAAAADKAEREELPPLFDYLARNIPATGFLIEDRLTLADLAVCSPFASLAHAGVSIDAARWPGLAAYVEAILGRPAFAALIAKERVMLAR